MAVLHIKSPNGTQKDIDFDKIVTGVKGNSESTYRSGNVNITAANIGAAASNHNHDSTYLSSAGGTITGKIISTNIEVISSNVDNAYTMFSGGSNYDNGATLSLIGKNRNDEDKGCFELTAKTDAGNSTLVGFPDGELLWNDINITPVGLIIVFAGITIPKGWLLCDGSEVSRTTYPSLFSVIGTTYGAGNGSTTFNLPNLVNRFVEGGSSPGAVLQAGLPGITGRTITFASSNYYSTISSNVPSGAFNYIGVEFASLNGGSDRTITVGAGDFNASWSNSIYGNSTTVQPPALTLRYLIKYQ